MIARQIIFFGKPACVCCDKQCHKAWGINQRPKVQLSKTDPDDYYFLADHEIAEDAPANPRSYEGGDAKPTAYEDPENHLLNKWCIRECERSELSSVNKPGEVISPRDFSKRLYNKPESDPNESPHFICDMCGGKFPRGNENEAESEMHKYFGYIPQEERAVVCDACWDLIRPDVGTLTKPPAPPQ